MKEQDAIAKILDEVANATSLATDSVRTEGGDESVNPPEVIISWFSERLDTYNGANPYAGTATDASGNEDAFLFHLYYQMSVDCLVRAQKEIVKDNNINNIQDQFAEYEYDAARFHADTAEWSVGSSEPRNNPVMEPDWYQSAVPLRFVLVREIEVSEDTLGTVEVTGANDIIDSSLEDGDITVGN